MDLVGRMLQSKIVILLVVGVVMLISARFIGKGRAEEEHSGAVERVLWAGGILITVAAIMYAISRGCMVDVPKPGKNELPVYTKEAPGCSKPDKSIEEYKK
jgi:heme/copper-type cytochrome/quinol oxidase subunit 2